jgi:hypothetical protein
MSAAWTLTGRNSEYDTHRSPKRTMFGRHPDSMSAARSAESRDDRRPVAARLSHRRLAISARSFSTQVAAC